MPATVQRSRARCYPALYPDYPTRDRVVWPRVRAIWPRVRYRAARNPESASEIEQVLQADGEAGELADAADAQQDARRERRAVHGVVPDREGLTVETEQYLLVGDEPGQPYRVDVDPVHVGAAGAVEFLAGRVRHRPAPGLGPRLGHQFGGAARGPRGRVGLLRVVQLDDLLRVEVAGRLR